MLQQELVIFLKLVFFLFLTSGEYQVSTTFLECVFSSTFRDQNRSDTPAFDYNRLRISLIINIINIYNTPVSAFIINLESCIIWINYKTSIELNLADLYVSLNLKEGLSLKEKKTYLIDNPKAVTSCRMYSDWT